MRTPGACSGCASMSGSFCTHCRHALYKDAGSTCFRTWPSQINVMLATGASDPSQPSRLFWLDAVLSSICALEQCQLKGVHTRRSVTVKKISSSGSCSMPGFGVPFALTGQLRC